MFFALSVLSMISRLKRPIMGRKADAPDPVDLARELQTLKWVTMRNEPTPAQINRLLEIIEDLSWYRIYGFRDAMFEDLLRKDPGAKAIHDKVVREEADV